MITAVSPARILRRDPGFTVVGRLPDGNCAIGHFDSEADAADYARTIDTMNRSEREARVSGGAAVERPCDSEAPE